MLKEMLKATIIVAFLTIGLFSLAGQAGVFDEDEPVEVEDQQLCDVPPLGEHVWVYLNERLKVNDRNSPIVICRFIDRNSDSAGLIYELWIVKTHQQRYPASVFCYPELNYECGQHYVQEQRQPPGSAPTPTPYQPLNPS